MGRPATDLTDFRSGKLTATHREGSTAQGAALWFCRCDCGEFVLVRGTKLKSGQIQSCGCGMREYQNSPKDWEIHGQAGTPKRKPTSLYNTWTLMRSRCCKVRNPDYPSYGGRGVQVCERWLNSFTAFQEDMGPKPGASYTIDRIDVNGNYTPENCRWATRKEQARNRRDNVFVSYEGETLCLTNWSERFGVAARDIKRRLYLGWSIERALREPSRMLPKRRHGDSERSGLGIV